jgi:PPOX class probable F420-dependent enzyme
MPHVGARRQHPGDVTTHQPLPSHIHDFLRQPNFAVLATLSSDGSPRTAVTWYEWTGEQFLFTMDLIRQRVKWLESDPRVSLTVIDMESWYRHVTLIGRVVKIGPDVDLTHYHRLHRRYRGKDAADVNRERFVAWAEVDSWYSWDGAQAKSDARFAPLDGTSATRPTGS